MSSMGPQMRSSGGWSRRQKERPVFHFVAAVVFAMLCLSASAETYIIPISATGLHGSDGRWWAQATVLNPNEFPVSVHVTRVYPMQTADCSSCTGQTAPVVIPPKGERTLNPPSGRPGRRLIAGAFELETTGPVHIHLVAYRSGAQEIRQRLDVARSWLLPGTRNVSTVESGGDGWRMNVFVVNPGDRDLKVSIWAGLRAENEVRATVAAGTTGVIGLPPPRCSGHPCPTIPVYPPLLLTVHVEADGVFLASVSSISNDWAVFSLADEAFMDPM